MQKPRDHGKKFIFHLQKIPITTSAYMFVITRYRLKYVPQAHMLNVSTSGARASNEVNEVK
jgi:hypothetical protein